MNEIFNIRNSFEYLLDPDEELEILNDFASKKEERQEGYFEYLGSDYWQELRQKRLEQDNYECARCGSKRCLQVHHHFYRNRYQTQLSDLITLCESCHESEHR
ncbi:MAG: HNH endonuclease [Oscillatoria sp. SIO1A7]|nr:HNH endonuclease [Oscillatoria sp. SIO1A7]